MFEVIYFSIINDVITYFREQWAAVSQVYLRYTDVHSRLQEALLRTLTLIEQSDEAGMGISENVLNYVRGIPETDFYSIVMEARDLCQEFEGLMEEEPGNEEQGRGRVDASNPSRHHSGGGSLPSSSPEGESHESE